MAKFAMLIAGSLIAAVPLPAFAEAPGPQAAEIAARDRATNQSLLNALVKRRAELTRTGGTREAFDFLDKRIAEVRARLAR